jgi:hypothetical protein
MTVRRAAPACRVILLLVLTVPPARSQAPLTHEDSVLLATQPTRQLIIQPSLLHRLNLLAAGLDREVVLCLQGTVSGDTAVVGDFIMPDLVSSTADGVAPLPCGPATLAVWHNHPWTGPDTAFGIRGPADFCSLSEPDIRTVVAAAIPFAVVSVGRAGRPVLCWWRRVQVVLNRHVRYLPRYPRQWTEPPDPGDAHQPAVPRHSAPP